MTTTTGRATLRLLLLILTTIRRLAVILFAFLVWTPAAYAWSWPVQGPVVQPFSYDESHPYASGQHRGIDIGADATGETVVAPAAGTVSFAGSVPTNGKTVTIETADGYSVTLTHLGSIAVTKGATVAEQQAVGTVGPSGTPEVDGPYVHLGIRVTADPNGYVDPLSLLPPTAASGANADRHDRVAAERRLRGRTQEQARALGAGGAEEPAGGKRPRIAAPSRSGARSGCASNGRSRPEAAHACSRDAVAAPFRGARPRERADRELFPAAGRRADGSQADRSRRRPRASARRLPRDAATRAVQPAPWTRLQRGRRAVRARGGVRRTTAAPGRAPSYERPGPPAAAAGGWA